MSKEEELFKQQLDAMLNSQSFEMGADNWSGMELLLKKEKRKRRGFFILFTGIGLLLLSSLLWLLMPQAKSTPMTATTKSSNKYESEKLIPQIKSLEQKIAAPAAKLSAPGNANTPKPTTSASKPQSTEVVKPAPAPVRQHFVKSNDEQGSYTSVLEVTPSIVAGNTTVNETISETIKPAEPVAGPQNTTANAQDIAPADASMPPVVSEPSVPSSSGQAPIATKNEEPAAVVSVTQSEQPTVAKTDSVVKINALKPDTAAALIAKPDTDYVAQKHLSYLLEAGITALSGWQENDKRDAAGLNPLFGAHVSYPLTPDLDVAIGLQYTMVGHLKYSKYTATTSHLDLGRVDQSLVFTPTRLHYLLLPLQASFKLDKKQSLGGGLSFGYLLTADSKVETYTYDYFGTALVNTEKKKGYTEGFRNFDAQVSLHYKYFFTSYLQANISVMFGLMDVKTGEALPSEGFERNSGAKMSLLYTLFRK